MKTLVAILILVASFAGSVRAEEQRLVTLTGELNPEFSFEVNKADLARIFAELKTIGDLEPVKININSLMEPGDEQSIRKAAAGMAGVFVQASKILIDLKAMIYRLDALEQIYENERDRDGLREAFQDKFKMRYLELLSLITLLRPSMVEAIEECRSEYCISKVVMAARTMILFGEILNDRGTFSPKTVKFVSPLFKAALESALGELQGRTRDYDKMVSAGVASFVLAGRGELNFKALIERMLASKKTLKRLGLKIPSLGSDVFVAEEDWLREIGRTRLREIVLGGDLARPGKTKHARVHILLCGTVSDFGWHAGIVGKMEGTRATCSSARTDEKFNFTFGTFGPGAMVQMMSSFVAVIVSPTIISPEGLWAGPSLGAAVVFGPEIAFMGGRGGSTLTILGFAGGFGARVGISAIEFRRAP